MQQNKMDYDEFEKMFNQCMDVRRVWIPNYPCVNPKGDKVGSWSSIEPKMIIRDLDANFNEDFNLDDCDNEFIDIERAWRFYKKTDKCRIMDANGDMWFDNYIDVQ